jgi:hypothetical protein
MWETILICTIILVVVVFLLRLFKNIEFQTTNQGILHPFLSDLRFDPFPQQIDVSNPYECSGTNLRPCTISDQTSCIGCQSMIARCTNFSSDTTYFDDDGHPHIIPKNTDPDDGYCMTITNNDLNIECNVFHGDLALIKIEPESQASMFFCNCKNPGFIGNTSLLGACDTPFICNGKVDDINKPLSEINCKCSATQYSVRNNNAIPLPMCVDMTIFQANNRNQLNDLIRTVHPEKLAPIGVFNNAIQRQLNVESLIHPCKTCPLTNNPIDNGVFGTIEDETFCSVHLNNVSSRNSHYGIPYRRSPNERLLVGDQGGPDAVLGVHWYEMMIYDHLLSDQRQIILFKIEPQLNEDFYTAMGLDLSLDYWIYTDNLLLGLHIPTPAIDFTTIPGTTCWEGWPNYDCTFGVNIINGTNQPVVNFFNNVLDYIAPNTNIQRAPLINSRPSGPFLLDLDAWREMQNLNQYINVSAKQFGDNFYSYLYLDGFRSATPRTSRFAGDAQLISWGFRRKSTLPITGWEYSMYTNGNANDWNFINGRLIPM